MIPDFEIATGTVIGKDHLWEGINNQDAYYVVATDECIIALLADGCSSSSRGEFGAILAPRLLAKNILNALEGIFELGIASFTIKIPNLLERARQDMLAQMRIIAQMMKGKYTEIIQNHFLFTLVGCVICPKTSVFFSNGDGVILINNELNVIGPFENNCPPYLSYSLLEHEYWGVNPDSLKFQMQKILETEKLEHALIGSDGVGSIIASCGKNLPGTDEKICSLMQLCTEDKYFATPFALQRQLKRMNRHSQKIDWEKSVVSHERGHLPDDTTIVAIRKKIRGKEKNTCSSQ